MYSRTTHVPLNLRNRLNYFFNIEPLLPGWLRSHVKPLALLLIGVSEEKILGTLNRSLLRAVNVIHNEIRTADATHPLAEPSLHVQSAEMYITVLEELHRDHLLFGMEAFAYSQAVSSTWRVCEVLDWYSDQVMFLGLNLAEEVRKLTDLLKLLQVSKDQDVSISELHIGLGLCNRIGILVGESTFSCTESSAFYQYLDHAAIFMGFLLEEWLIWRYIVGETKTASV